MNHSSTETAAPRQDAAPRWTVHDPVLRQVAEVPALLEGEAAETLRGLERLSAALAEYERRMEREIYPVIESDTRLFPRYGESAARWRRIMSRGYLGPAYE